MYVIACGCSFVELQLSSVVISRSVYLETFLLLFLTKIFPEHQIKVARLGFLGATPLKFEN